MAATIFFAHCVVHKKAKYIYPEGISEKEKDNLFAVLEKGRKLYEAYCSNCHDNPKSGKAGMPDFSKQQMDNYTAAALRRDPKNHSAAANMDSEQLNEVFMYLRFRKKEAKDK